MGNAPFRPEKGTDRPMTQEYMNIVIERNRDDDAPNYTVTALDMDQRKHIFDAMALNVNGVGFATSGAEFGEYDHPLKIEQETQGGYLDIITE